MTNIDAINCILVFYSNSLHLEQVYTGLGILHSKGILNIQLEKSDFIITNNPGPPIIKLTIENGPTLLFDTNDSHKLITNSKIIEGVDFYFKRSYHHDGYANQTLNYKVFPLGFNYAVFGANSFILERLNLEVGIKRKVEFMIRQNSILSSLLRFNTSAWTCLEHRMHSLPNFHYPDYKILFLTRIWPEQRAKNQEEKDRRIHLNYMRSELIRSLRKEFKHRFFGGLFIDEYSKKYYSDCLLPSNNYANKINYLKLLHEYPICVTSSGHHSAGWSIGEYTAFSKAIVAEKIRDLVPGNYTPNNNYLEFEQIDKCIDQCEFLLNNPSFCTNMMTNNYRYYQSYLRPESLVLNAINTAITQFI